MRAGRNFHKEDQAIRLAKELTGSEYRCYRAYVNYCQYGDNLFTHTELGVELGMELSRKSSNLIQRNGQNGDH